MSARYFVLDVGCLECADGDNCAPETVASVDSLETAVTIARARKPDYNSQFDVFILDTENGRAISIDEWREM